MQSLPYKVLIMPKLNTESIVSSIKLICRRHEINVKMSMKFIKVTVSPVLNENLWQNCLISHFGLYTKLNYIKIDGSWKHARKTPKILRYHVLPCKICFTEMLKLRFKFIHHWSFLAFSHISLFVCVIYSITYVTGYFYFLILLVD